MPLVFIVAGLILLLMLFKVLNFRSSILNFLLAFILISILLSFILPDIVCEGVKFDILLAISVCLLIVLSVFCVNFSVWDIVLILSVAIFYKMIVDNNLNYLLSYDSNFGFALIVCSSLLYFKTYIKGIMYTCLSSLLILFISTSVDLMNLNFSLIDLNFVFIVIVAYSAIYVIFHSLNFSLSRARRFYVKKSSDCFCLNAYISF